MQYDHAYTISFIFITFLLLVPLASAVYNEEGLLVETIAQGVIRGSIQINGTYGLANPPMTCIFPLTGEPVWSRIYTGIWGGTEFYSGWIECEVNGKKLDRVTLYGKDDQTPGIYSSSHGVYWIAFDGSGLLHEGTNTITVSTSRGEEGSKLDGRVYAVHGVALVEDANAPLYQYWIAEGNDNLHGEGWAGTNPTRKDQAEVIFAGAFPELSRSAEMVTLMLATNYGQPDYILFNGHEIGKAPGDTSLYAPGAMDIGNEQSFDAEGAEGQRSRYVDCEVFSTVNAISETNRISFLRGKDLNGDGQLSTSGTPAEAEDYLHPVFLALITSLSGTDAPIDMAVRDLQVSNAYSGSTAEISATVVNYGAIPSGGADVIFESDGKSLATRQITVDHSGIQEVRIPWNPETEAHELTVRVIATGDSRPGNNEARKKVSTGSLPDLLVTLGNPVRADASQPAPTSAPLSLLPALLAPLGALGLYALRRGRPLQHGMLIMIFALLLAGIPMTSAPVQAAGDLQKYTIPIEVKNQGGSDAGPCSVSLFLDGEKVAMHTISGGIPAGTNVKISLAVTASPGSHQLKVIVDETEQVADGDRSNNQVQGFYGFP